MLADYKLGTNNSWTKCLTEILTNSHQSYHEMMEAGYVFTEKPTIQIIADSIHQKFVVIDHAAGIAKDFNELKKLMCKYSEHNPKSHTPEKRSSFGRGLSDVLLRQKEYTSTILSRRGDNCLGVSVFWGSNEPKFRKDPALEVQAAKEIPEHGTIVEFFWDSKIEKRNFPGRIELQESLCKYYELKNVLSDEKIDVNLIYLDKKSQEIQKIKFFNYSKEPVGPELSDIPLDVKKGYDIRIKSAKMYRSKGCILSQEEGEKRTGGLSIEGEYGQIYDLTMFDLERDYRDVALRLGGVVILSKDAKRYMDDEYTSSGETILTRTREGFRKNTKFWLSLRKALFKWIQGILDAEEQKSSYTESSQQFQEGIKMLDDLAKKLLGSKNLETEEGPSKKEEKLPDTIKFSPVDAKVEQGVTCKVALLINTERVSPGTKINFKIGGTNFADFKFTPETDRVPKPLPGSKLAKVPISVECDVLGAEAEIIAETTKKNTQSTGQQFCFLICVEESFNDIINPTEYLEFFPKKTSAEIYVKKQVNLWMHPNMVPQGSKIKIEFTSTTHSLPELPISFGEDKSQTTLGPTHVFEIEAKDSPTQPNGYRKQALTFVGTEEGLAGIIKASMVNPLTDIKPTICEIEITSAENKTALLSGYEFLNSDYSMYAWYEKNKGKVIFNLSVPLVKRILGKTREEATARCQKLQEAQLFVGQTMMDIFLDEVIVMLYESNRLRFNVETPSYRQSHQQMILEKHKLIKDYGKEILLQFAPNIRESVQGGKVKEINIGSDRNHHMKYWLLERKQNVTPPIQFNDLPELRGQSADLTTFHFELPGLTFKIAVYHFSNHRFVVVLHDYDKDRKYNMVLDEIAEIEQVYKPTEKEPPGLRGKELVYTLVTLTRWCGMTSNRITSDLIRNDEHHRIPDSPSLNPSNILYETSPNWIDITGRPLVEYDIYDNVVHRVEDEKYRKKVVSLLPKENPEELMVLNFVRTKMIPVFHAQDEIFRKLVNVGHSCANKDCEIVASGPAEILTRFGVYFDGKTPKPREVCKKCSGTDNRNL